MWPTSWGDSSSIYLMYLLCIYRKETWNRSRLYMVYIIDPSTIIIRTVSGRRELLTISLCWAGKRCFSYYSVHSLYICTQLHPNYVCFLQISNSRRCGSIQVVLWMVYVCYTRIWLRPLLLNVFLYRTKFHMCCIDFKW